MPTCLPGQLDSLYADICPTNGEHKDMMLTFPEKIFHQVYSGGEWGVCVMYYLPIRTGCYRRSIKAKEN